MASQVEMTLYYADNESASFSAEIKRRASGRKVQRSYEYARIEIEFNVNEFDQTTNASGSANWDEIQAWLKHPIRRIAWDTTKYAEAGGLTTWNSGSNTNYVNIIDFQYEWITSGDLTDGQPSVRTVKMVVETRDTI
jgi:hypothetical protein